MMLVFWPGVAMYDTVAQYDEVLSNDVDDWHPPVMVRLWQLLNHLAGGTVPVFLLQTVLYALGFALIVAALVRSGRSKAAAATFLLAVSPLLLGWQMVVLKDGQMLGALLLAVGLWAHFRIGGNKVPAYAAALIALLTVYATLVRANALFATMPLAVLLIPRPAAMSAKFGLALGAMLAMIALTPLINQRLFGATSSGIAKSQPMFDLAAIAAASPQSVAPYTMPQRAQLIARHCVKSFFWDPIADPGSCGPVTKPAYALSEQILYRDLGEAIVSHPIDYAEHRLLHWNSTEWWLVPSGRIGAAPPDEAEPNDLGLATPKSPIMPVWQGAAAIEAQSPLGWPIFWTAIALLLLPFAWRNRARPNSELALALLVSALTLEASFVVISIASDLRYHLWSMTAAALALILQSSDVAMNRRAWFLRSALLLMIIAAGAGTRVLLPSAPVSYQGMLHAPTG